MNGFGKRLLRIARSVPDPSKPSKVLKRREKARRKEALSMAGGPGSVLDDQGSVPGLIRDDSQRFESAPDREVIHF